VHGTLVKSKFDVMSLFTILRRCRNETISTLRDWLRAADKQGRRLGVQSR
jgi:hypothetical protein